MVKSVRIGAPVRHEWQCSGVQEDQCLVVTNCFIKTVDSQHLLIDEFGCATSNLIPGLEYVGKVIIIFFFKINSTF